MTRVTGTGQKILVAISFFSIKIYYNDLTIHNLTRGVQKGQGLFRFAATGSRLSVFF